MYTLVNPFVLNPAQWTSICNGLTRLAQSVKKRTAVVEVFTFDKTKDHIEWRDAPSGFKGPVATMHRRPYHLATYATEEIAEACARACAALGWKVERSGADQHLQAAIKQAVARLEDDVRASLLHQRRFLERVVYLAAQPCGLDLSFAGDAAARIRALESHLRPKHHVVRSMNSLRHHGNEAAREF